MRAPLGPYIHKVKYMGWVQLSSLVRSKRHGTACAIGPIGEARTLGLRAPSVQKANLGHSVRVRHPFLIFRKLYTWVGFNYPPWLGPKDTEPRSPLVPKAKLGYSDRVRHRSQKPSKDTQTACTIGPKGEARTHRLRVPSVPKVKLGY